MQNPCDIWIRIFVIAFIIIASTSLIVLVLRFIIDLFLEGGNILYHNQQRTIKILKDELRKYKDID